MSAIRGIHSIQEIVELENPQHATELKNKKIAHKDRQKTLLVLLVLSRKYPSNNKFRRLVEKEILQPDMKRYTYLLKTLQSIL